MTEQELLDYAIKMRSRGDTCRSMLGYLQNNSDDESMISRIIQKVDELEKSEEIKPEKPNIGKFSSMNIMMGLVLLCGGLVLIFFL